MLAPLELEPIALQARAVHRIDNGRGMQVTCVKGVVWVTQERDSRDIILVRRPVGGPRPIAALPWSTPSRTPS